ncbi:MAG TPA: hypothetical protein VGM19_03095 [Armatimonadota bacterium]|jgi:hypothetical protein
MMTYRRSLVCAFLLILTVLVTPLYAQHLETYATPHLFALPTATTTRLFGMGGFVSCIKDQGFGQPAFAGMLTENSSVGRASITEFAGGLRLNGYQGSLAVPLKSDRQGLQITSFTLTSKAGLMNTPLGPVSARLAEEDLSLQYGYRVSPQWVFGIGVSPKLHTDTDLSNPLNGMPLAHYHSTAKLGARLGGTYQFSNEGCAGFIFDNYTEDVRGSGLAIGPPVSDTFTSREIVIGVSQRLSRNVLGAVEWQQLSSKGAGVTVGDSGLRVGVEVQPAPAWAFRLGSNLGAASTGLGYQDDAWSCNYTYVRNWNDDSVGPLFGHSNTNQLELQYHW